MKIVEKRSDRIKFRDCVRLLERPTGRNAIAMQAAFAVVDLAILAFFLLGPYLRSSPSYLIVDYIIAAWIGLELMVRAVAAPSLRHWLARPLTWIDLVLLVTLLFPDALFNFAFLRVMRLWAIGQSPLLKEVLRRAGCVSYLDVVRAVLNFLVFLFLMTGFVYTTFFYNRDGSEGFIDALYFTVATVTTTGFGDITLPGTVGKLTSVFTMIIGISLFVRLAQAIVRPHKVTFPCPRCALQRHDADAVHCKACGEVLNIPDEGS
ncbi:ion transporter [Rhizobium sp. Leaf306]|jgi:voltage-gated potassium channel|uniref:potassium channel family protein n=2 Tax=Rhizobium/Agrobacterium group TaxID=227290 RepID=UPI000714D29A|nr:MULTISPECIES: potassium channel family protein [unclassified Rhizobium]RYE64190.1 MAG: ion transporter [Rhizobiaceae bacterium]KQQ33204.1 ion transporter [Rhizobium sp. Leaf306]MBD8665620.1 potassium channel family protein [Rhizobium sp. CFBP 8752]MBP2531549.1 voltage-gated potassium channel [Rhizobium sp. PvP099]SEH29678.1 voltage-gated potassium channel [Rhizobium sp. NFR12]